MPRQLAEPFAPWLCPNNTRLILAHTVRLADSPLQGVGRNHQKSRPTQEQGAAGLACRSDFLYYVFMRKLAIVFSEPRTPGRPPTGSDPVVTLRLPQQLIDMLDSVAKAEGATRSDVMRELLEFGLNARKGKIRVKK
jgi:hypothetical protein